MTGLSLQCAICQTGFNYQNPPYILVHRETEGCAANFHKACARQWTRGCPNCRTTYSGMQKNLALLQALNESAADRTVSGQREAPPNAQHLSSSTTTVATRSIAPRMRQRISGLAQEHQLGELDPLRYRSAMRSIRLSVMHSQHSPEPRTQRVSRDPSPVKVDHLLQLYISSGKFTSMDSKVLAKELEATIEEIPEPSFVVIHSHMQDIFEEHVNLSGIHKGRRYDLSLIRDKGLLAIVAKFDQPWLSFFKETTFQKIVLYATQNRPEHLKPDQQKLVCRGYIEYLTHCIA
jgi:hypothetical protein